MVSIRTKALFFDRAEVIAAIGKKSAQAMAKAGAFIRRTAKSSIRKRKGVSPAGSPPSSHTGLLKDGIFFSFDPQAASVVIGPELLNKSSFSPDEGTIPRALERGGTVVIRRTNGPRKRQRGDKVVRIAARPFMAPALEKEAPKFPDLFAG